jgi:hypothetical protein
MRKTITLILLAVAALVLTSMSALAAHNADPYDGVNRIGTYYQYQRSVAFNVEPAYAYDYVAQPRTGGWFGSGTEWIVGLRPGVHTTVPPVRYSPYYVPVCGWPCHSGGGYGYARPTATDFPAYRTRVGGVFGY